MTTEVKNMWNERFGGNLVRLRADKISQKKLADAAGVSARVIGMWENGERGPSWASAAVIAKVLNVSLDEFTKPVKLKR